MPDSQGTAIQRFNFGDWAIRIEVIDGEPWFVAADVCAALDIINPSHAVTRLDEADLANSYVSSSGQRRSMKIVNESGLYDLVLDSRKPEAKKFRKWITSEVLPSIRKTGSYGAAPVRELSRMDLIEMAMESEKARLALKAKIVELQPKVEAFQQFIEADGLFSLATAAQSLGLGRNKLIAKLAEWRIIMVRPGHTDHLRPYQQHIEAGRFVVKVAQFTVEKDGEIEVRTSGTTRVTPKGLEYIFSEIEKDKLRKAKELEAATDLTSYIREISVE